MGVTHDGKTEKTVPQQQTVELDAGTPLPPRPQHAIPQSKLLAKGESIHIPLRQESLPIEIGLSPGMKGSRSFEVLRTESGQWVLRNKTNGGDLISLTEGRELELSRGLISNMSQCISRKHAKLEAKDGELIVSDIQSKFGTEVLFYATSAR